MQAIVKLLGLLALLNALPAPDHCYDFTSRTVLDGCGSLHLNKFGKLLPYPRWHQWLAILRPLWLSIYRHCLLLRNPSLGARQDPHNSLLDERGLRQRVECLWPGAGEYFITTDSFCIR